jgi:hypothetical protein
MFYFHGDLWKIFLRTTVYQHLLSKWTLDCLQGSFWPWSYGSWIYNYPCNQCLSTLMLRVWTPLRRGVLDTLLCDNDCQWLAADPVFSTNKTDHHDITEILLKVALNTITLDSVQGGNEKRKIHNHIQK